jgi:sugar phosphate isomerase/epimerase
MILFVKIHLFLFACFILSQTAVSQPLIPTHLDESVKFDLGIASYAFRKKPLDDVLHMAQLLDVHKIALKSYHLALDAGDQEIEDVREKANKAEVDLYAAAVIYMKNEEQVRQAFEYAKNAGMAMIVGVPNPELIDLCEQMVAAYNIKLAIHNHGARDILYPDAGSAYELIKNRDSRMGLCLDVGHTLRLNLNPADEIYKYQDRLLDVQIWDVYSASHEGKSTLAGYGVLNFKEILQALIEVGYQETLSVEYWNDPENPGPGTAYTIGYIRSILDNLSYEKKADNQLSVEEQQDGWQLLFNGSHTEGWRGINKASFPATGWEVKDGALCSTSGGGAESANGGDIVSTEEYRDFILSWEWKMLTPGGNSGVKYFVQEGISENNKYGYGIEYQLLDDANHGWMTTGEMKPGDYRTVAGAYELYAPENKKLKPLGQYNQSTIQVMDGIATHWLNGNKVLEFDRFSDDFINKVNESKFKTIDSFGQWPAGHILLQDHGSEVCFKNLKMKKLN